jgi:hypothetical protein
LLIHITFLEAFPVFIGIFWYQVTKNTILETSVGDPDPLVRGAGSGSHKGVERNEIMLAK